MQPVERDMFEEEVEDRQRLWRIYILPRDLPIHARPVAMFKAPRGCNLSPTLVAKEHGVVVCVEFGKREEGAEPPLWCSCVVSISIRCRVCSTHVPLSRPLSRGCSYSLGDRPCVNLELLCESEDQSTVSDPQLIELEREDDAKWLYERQDENEIQKHAEVAECGR